MRHAQAGILSILPAIPASTALMIALVVTIAEDEVPDEEQYAFIKSPIRIGRGERVGSPNCGSRPITRIPSTTWPYSLAPIRGRFWGRCHRVAATSSVRRTQASRRTASGP